MMFPSIGSNIWQTMTLTSCASEPRHEVRLIAKRRTIWSMSWLSPKALAS